MVLFEKTINSIGELYKDKMEVAQKRLDSLTKPLGSLGRLEEIAMRIVGITGEIFPKVDNKCIIIMCADNGIVDEGVSSCPKSVTAAVTVNFTRGITGINVLSKHAGSRIYVVDIGVDADVNLQGVHNRKVRYGTANMAKGPAMTRDEAIKAIETGIDVVNQLKGKGVNLLGTGEMGIGNTTTSTAITSVLAGCPVEMVVGKGSGLTKEGLVNKTEIIKQVIEINRPDASDPIDTLSKVGGLDIAGLAGCYLGAAYNRVPILIDGFIAGAAALAAISIEPKVKDFIFPSHGSAEPGSAIVMERLGMRPVLDLEMRLGEGTGAAIGFHVIDAAIAAYTQMGTFDDAIIEQYVPLE